MLVNATGRFLKVSENSFTDENGRLVPYYRVNLIDNENEPCVLPCTQAVYNQGGYFENLQPVSLQLSISYTSRGVKCRVTNLDEL